jgi:opacity protein-like surface antigen
VRRSAGLVVAVAALLCAAQAAAQDPVPAGRVEIGGGLEWLGSFSLGSSDATETTSDGGSSTLFSTSSSLEGALGFQGHVGVRLTKRFEAQMIGAFSQPTLSTTITNDLETSDKVTATDSIIQYVIGGGVLWYVPLRTSPKLAPFVTANAAYLRQLHEARTLVVTGQLYRVSGGVKYLLASRADSRLKSYGVRAEGGFAVRVNGVAFDDRAHVSPWIAATLFVRLGGRR